MEMERLRSMVDKKIVTLDYRNTELSIAEQTHIIHGLVNDGYGVIIEKEDKDISTAVDVWVSFLQDKEQGRRDEERKVEDEYDRLSRINQHNHEVVQTEKNKLPKVLRWAFRL